MKPILLNPNELFTKNPGPLLGFDPEQAVLLHERPGTSVTAGCCVWAVPVHEVKEQHVYRSANWSDLDSEAADYRIRRGLGPGSVVENTTHTLLLDKAHPAELIVCPRGQDNPALPFTRYAPVRLSKDAELFRLALGPDGVEKLAAAVKSLAVPAIAADIKAQHKRAHAELSQNERYTLMGRFNEACDDFRWEDALDCMNDTEFDWLSEEVAECIETHGARAVLLDSKAGASDENEVSMTHGLFEVQMAVVHKLQAATRAGRGEEYTHLLTPSIASAGMQQQHYSHSYYPKIKAELVVLAGCATMHGAPKLLETLLTKCQLQDNMTLRSGISLLDCAIARGDKACASVLCDYMAAHKFAPIHQGVAGSVTAHADRSALGEEVAAKIAALYPSREVKPSVSLA